MAHSESILESIGDKQGWDDASKLALALEYIDNQQDDAAWREFLEIAADSEMDDF
jgi:hypothetical protein